MIIKTHSGRVAGPLAFLNASGTAESIPLGPCFVEESSGGSVAVSWGLCSEWSATLTAQEASEATNEGNMVLLD